MHVMANFILHDVPMADVSQSFISKLHCSLSNGLPHAQPVPAFKANESDLVHGVLQMLQGFSSSIFYWDKERQRFRVKNGIYASHLSKTSLSGILNQFAFVGTCLKQVELFVKKVEASHQRAPTLKAFANSVRSWLERLRDIALREQVASADLGSGMSTTLLELTDSLSSLCSGAEHLVQVVCGAIPNAYFDSEMSIHPGEMAVHILDHLFKKLNEVCLVQGGEEEAYHMQLAIFTESLLPYLEGLDSWLYEGTLDDPCEEMFFYANGSVAIDQPAFWEMSYLLRLSRRRKSSSNGSMISSNIESIAQVRKGPGDQETFHLSSSARVRDQTDMDVVLCPVFLKDIAKAIISAGKSLQLIRHVRNELYFGFHRFKEVGPEILSSQVLEDKKARHDYSNGDSIDHPYQMSHAWIMGALTLSEVFLVSLAGLVGSGDHVHEYFKMSFTQIAQICHSFMLKQKLEKDTADSIQTSVSYEKAWFRFLSEAISERGRLDAGREARSQFISRPVCSADIGEFEDAAELHSTREKVNNAADVCMTTSISSFCPRNPVITLCREHLQKNTASWNELNISRSFHIPPLNDESLRKAIFGEKHTDASMSADLFNSGEFPKLKGTDYTSGFRFDEFERLRVEDDTKTLETLFPFPTLLPCFDEDFPMSKLLPFQKNSTLASRILNWIRSIKLRDTPQPAVVIKECLAMYVKKQVDHIGKHILLKLMSDWKLMDELSVLRAIYLLGSGDLLQQFMMVIYDKMDKGESWDDDFELNTILQESIRNSADGTLLRSPDSLVVSVSKHNDSDDKETADNNISTPGNVRSHCFGIDALDMLKFTYKVSWPLDLIANAEALKKYNQVMGFLLKVKRAKFVLDKTRRWMWKQGRANAILSYKRHLLVEQKLLHFVDAFHQYVMDRVFHSAWIELCTGMASAGTLDEVIEVHDAYLLSIQRQCFVAPDKLWALIANRIKNILGLALDFYSIQQTLSSGGAAPAIKARCEMEVDRIEKQFDDCIAFLLRILSFRLNVGHFPHLADLVTRINYNHFYMSDNGNLLTVPRFEASSRLAKASAFRME